MVKKLWTPAFAVVTTFYDGIKFGAGGKIIYHDREEKAGIQYYQALPGFRPSPE
jgi:hypothetical protein